MIDLQPFQVEVEIDRLDPDVNQPRKRIAGLDSLAANIKAVGIVQPIVVRPHPNDESRYIIVLGERRWRAAKLAGLTHVLVICRRDIPNDRIFFMQVVENLCDYRHPLEAHEKALALQQYVEQVGVDKACEELGQKKDWISRETALAKVPDEVWALAEEEKIGDRRTILDLSRLVKHTGKDVKDEWQTIAQLGPSKRQSLHARMEASGVKKKREPKTESSHGDAPVVALQSQPAPDGGAQAASDAAAPTPLTVRVADIEQLPAQRPPRFRRPGLEERLNKAGKKLGIDPDKDFESFLDALLTPVVDETNLQQASA